jgi:sterol desaturase/sphingolipid hydroxylase (fatty acid hydroxylase superfamily)
MLATVLGLILALGVLAVCFALLERRRASGRWFAALRRPGARADVAWWLLGPLLAGPVVRVLVGAAILLGVLLLGGSPEHWRGELAAGRFPDPSPWGLGAWLRALPFGLELLLGLLVADLAGYVSHRLFHRGRLWRVHAVHHSSERLDWLAAARVHPLNEVGARFAQAAPLLLLGFDPLVFAAAAPVLTLYAVLLHADVPWTFGPLRFVLASPAFHRWHHAADREALDKNFAGLFPVWDLLFGTFHMPQGRAPARLGIRGERVPPGVLGQLAYPFRRRARRAA